jgi:transposase
MAKKQGKEITMRTKREVFRLALVSKLSHRKIAQSCGIDHKTVSKYLDSLPVELLDYGEIESLSDEELANFLKPSESDSVKTARPLPNWEEVHQELQRKGVTLKLIWEEYKQDHPGGYQSSQFNAYYRRWAQKSNLSMHQTHLAGEKLFVDYAGVTVPIRDRHTGKTRDAQVFVAVLGASSYIYAEATLDQSSPNWLRSHVRAFESLGGVPKMVIPDNLKSAVTRACRYDPDLNPAYPHLSIHYDTATIPARVRKPQDKAKVEQGVQVVEQRVLAPLRKITFFDLGDLNRRIREGVAALNMRQMEHRGVSRQTLFEQVDRPALQSLPTEKYVVEEWKSAKVNLDYHVEVAKHYYSVPHKYVHERVEIRYTEQTVEIWRHNQRLASHRRIDLPGGYSTIHDHMPIAHQEYQKWTPERIIKWAASMGENTAELAQQIIDSKAYPAQGYRAVLGILGLAKKYSEERLERACGRALLFGNYRYKQIESILKKGLDQQWSPEPKETAPVEHQNLRGEDYYRQAKEKTC